MRYSRRRSMTMLAHACQLPQLGAVSAGVDQAAQTQPAKSAGSFEHRMSMALELVQQVQAVGSQQYAQLLDAAPAASSKAAIRRSDCEVAAKHEGPAAQQPSSMTARSSALGSAIAAVATCRMTKPVAAEVLWSSTPNSTPVQLAASACYAPAVGESTQILSSLHRVISMLEKQNRMLQRGAAHSVAPLRQPATRPELARRAAGSYQNAGSQQRSKAQSCDGIASQQAAPLRWEAHDHHNAARTGQPSRLSARTAHQRQRLQPQWDDSLAGQAPRQPAAAKLKRARPMQQKERPAMSCGHATDSCQDSVVSRHFTTSSRKRRPGAHSRRPQGVPAINQQHDCICSTCAAVQAANGLLGGWCDCGGQL